VLEANELQSLYKNNHFPADEKLMDRLFGKNVQLDLNKFTQLTADRDYLAKYSKQFKQAKRKMLKTEAANGYMPTSFEETMIELGTKLARKKLVRQVDTCLGQIDDAVKRGDKVESYCNRFVNAFEDLIKVNDQHNNHLQSESNVLYRRIYD
jgi:glutaredoxin 2